MADPVSAERSRRTTRRRPVLRRASSLAEPRAASGDRRADAPRGSASAPRRRQARRPTLRPRPAGRPVVLLAACLSAAGCYSLGVRPVEGIRSVAVPVFENLTLRRGLEHDLTRLVRREVLESTSLVLARQGSADAELRGAVVRVDEGVLVSGPAEEVLASSVTISARFGLYRGRRLVVGDDLDGDGAPDAELLLQGFAEFNAVRGETRADATAEALRDLAEMIAFRLGDPWDDRYEGNDSPDAAQLLAPGRHAALIQRDADWFRFEVPARGSLRVRLRGPSSLRLSGRRTEPSGEGDPARPREATPRTAGEGPFPLLARREAQGLEALGGAEPSTLLVCVEGDDEGRPYALEARASADDGAEPDSTPARARRLPGGTRRWRVYGIQRDDDFVAVSVPRGLGLRLRFLLPDRGPLTARLCDAAGEPLAGSRPATPARPLKRPPQERSERVLVRISGDDSGRPYGLLVELSTP
ncbi:MAG: hypothetical protein D6731_12000 [Planctomycetota bacterium]|nr:MAG: hypothetical protein D6731_12000 [Planctomycetota bacterium]